MCDTHTPNRHKDTDTHMPHAHRSLIVNIPAKQIRMWEILDSKNFEKFGE